MSDASPFASVDAYVAHLRDTGAVSAGPFPGSLLVVFGAVRAPRGWRRAACPFGTLRVARSSRTGLLCTAMVGAPAAGVLTDVAAHLGVSRLVVLGRAGSLVELDGPRLAVPSAAHGDDGVTATSGMSRPTRPCPALADSVARALGVDVAGATWTTDRPLHAGPDGAVIVTDATMLDMEASAVFAVAAARGLGAAAAFVLSDGPSGGRWRVLDEGAVAAGLQEAASPILSLLEAT